MPSQKASLRVPGGTEVVVQRGRVDVVGSFACLYETPADGPERLVDAICVGEGGRVRHIGEGNYVVEV